MKPKPKRCVVCQQAPICEESYCLCAECSRNHDLHADAEIEWAAKRARRFERRRGRRTQSEREHYLSALRQGPG